MVLLFNNPSIQLLNAFLISPSCIQETWFAFSIGGDSWRVCCNYSGCATNNEPGRWSHRSLTLAGRRSAPLPYFSLRHKDTTTITIVSRDGDINDRSIESSHDGHHLGYSPIHFRFELFLIFVDIEVNSKYLDLDDRMWLVSPSHILALTWPIIAWFKESVDI